jgi:hypothetical protein
MLTLMGGCRSYLAKRADTSPGQIRSFGHTKADATKRSGAGHGYKTVLSTVAMSGSIGLISIDKP